MYNLRPLGDAFAGEKDKRACDARGNSKNGGKNAGQPSNNPSLTE